MRVSYPHDEETNLATYPADFSVRPRIISLSFRTPFIICPGCASFTWRLHLHANASSGVCLGGFCIIMASK